MTDPEVRILMLKGDKGDGLSDDDMQKVNSLIFASAAETNENISGVSKLLNSRIDNLILHSGAESSAEVIDARTGYDGTAYETLGTAIRTQIKNTHPDNLPFINIGEEGFNTDANTYTKNGTYWIKVVPNLANLHWPNIEVGFGTFKVFSYSDGYVAQTLELTNGTYTRFCNGGDWSEWTRGVADRDRLPHIFTGEEGFNTDANTYTKNGVYWISVVPNLAHLHWPNVEVGFGTFKVFSYNDSYVAQTLELTTGTYTRYCNNGYWSEWTSGVADRLPFIITDVEGFNTDANAYTKNGTYWIKVVPNLADLHWPNIEVGFGTFKVFSYSDGYVAQTLELTNGTYTRFCNGGDWSEWTRGVADRDRLPHIFTGEEGFNTDANTYTKNGVYWISVVPNLTNLHWPNVEGFGTFKVFSYNDSYVTQTLELTNGTYTRFCNGGDWSEWSDTARTSIRPYTTGLAQFKKFGVIGDSLSVGYFSQTSDRNLWYSWPQSVARMHGNTAVNFGKSGDTVLSWWHENSKTGKDLLGASGNKCQAYVIALGVNDVWQNIPIGSFSDIDLSNYNNNKETWYGGYARIIQYISNINPNAIIFCLTNIWLNDEKSHQLDSAIREILANEVLGKQCLLVDMVANYSEEFNAFKNKYAMSGHNNANGYAIGGRIVDMAIGETFADSKFENADIGLIPCDE